MRQIALDTETTGLEPRQGHRIIEIGAVELVDRRLTGNHFHQYLQPDREIDEGALEVHGITEAFLAEQPRFADIARAFLDFVDGAELIIHNAPFDVGFIDHELSLLGSEWGCLGDYCQVIDTLEMARRLHPGQKNNLDALCRRYQVDNSQRDLHGALIDAELLAEVYLMMTGGQVSLSLEGLDGAGEQSGSSQVRRVDARRPALAVRRADAAELAAHQQRLQAIAKASGGKVLWRD